MSKYGSKRPQATITVAAHQRELGRLRRQRDEDVADAYARGRREVVDRINAALGVRLGIDPAYSSIEGRLRHILTVAVDTIDQAKGRTR